MLKSGEEILADIDHTLDQLIQNAQAISDVSCGMLQDHEISALQKTQESLLARILHMNHLLDSEKKGSLMRQKKTEPTIEEKIAEFGRLNTKLIEDVSLRFGKEKKQKYIRKMRAQGKKSYSKAC